MIAENLSILKIHKLTQKQYDRELEAGRIDESVLYLTPDEEVDLSKYATIEQLKGKADSSHTHATLVPSEQNSTLKFTPNASFYYALNEGGMTLDKDVDVPFPNGWFGFVSIYGPEATTIGAFNNDNGVLAGTSLNGFDLSDLHNQFNNNMLYFIVMKSTNSEVLNWYLLGSLPSAEGASF